MRRAHHGAIQYLCIVCCRLVVQICTGQRQLFCGHHGPLPISIVRLYGFGRLWWCMVCVVLGCGTGCLAGGGTDERSTRGGGGGTRGFDTRAGRSVVCRLCLPLIADTVSMLWSTRVVYLCTWVSTWTSLANAPPNILIICVSMILFLLCV